MEYVTGGSAEAPAGPVHTEFYSNDGATPMRTPEEWAELCGEIPTDTVAITTIYGSTIDYFKPIEGETFCSMLQSNSKHLWSPDGENWQQPEYYPSFSNWCGGASDTWFETIGVDRQMPGTWCSKAGNSHVTGGHGSPVKKSEWSQPFTMEYVTLGESATQAPALKADCADFSCTTIPSGQPGEGNEVCCPAQQDFLPDHDTCECDGCGKDNCKLYNGGSQPGLPFCSETVTEAGESLCHE
jgi:hypothetical protein